MNVYINKTQIIKSGYIITLDMVPTCMYFPRDCSFFRKGPITMAKRNSF